MAGNNSGSVRIDVPSATKILIASRHVRDVVVEILSREAVLAEMPLMRKASAGTEGEGSHAAEGNSGGVVSCVVGAAASHGTVSARRLRRRGHHTGLPLPHQRLTM